MKIKIDNRNDRSKIDATSEDILLIGGNYFLWGYYGNDDVLFNINSGELHFFEKGCFPEEVYIGTVFLGLGRLENIFDGDQSEIKLIEKLN